MKGQLAALGRPLVPQSVRVLERLFLDCDPSRFVEEKFVEAKTKADARLYRDPRFRVGITDTLDQKVADFREIQTR